MINKFETWCYGGNSKAFFIEQSEAIHQYNSKMMERLLLIMTIILGFYVCSEILTTYYMNYLAAYSVCFAVLLAMLCSYKLKANKSITFTKTYISLFFSVMFSFVCIIGTVFEPNSRAIMFFVYLLTLPMLFVVPTHYMYGFLTLAACVFSMVSLHVKDFMYARMDVAHGITCLVIGVFISHHILESRMTLYAVNKQLDAHNLRLGEQLQEKEQQLLQSRISILLSQIQPHFLLIRLPQSAVCVTRIQRKRKG